MADISGNNPYFPSGGGCTPQSGTAAFIRGLRNSSSLEVGCSYTVTGYSRGCLVATEIVLTATAPNALSFDADILTPHDNLYWEGRYDIDTNRVVALHDNRGNIVEGRYGNEVDRFPWGQASVNANIIQNADVYFDCGTTAQINENRFGSNSYADLRGFQGTFNENTLNSYARFYGNSLTTADITRNEFHTYSYVYMQSQDDVYMRQNTFGSSCYVRKFGGVERFYLANSVIDRGDLRQYSGEFYGLQINLASGGRLYQQGQNLFDVRYSSISDQSYILNRHAGTDYVRIWYCEFSSRAYHYVQANITAGRHFIYYSNFSSGTTDIRSGTALLRMYYIDRNSNGYIRLDNIAGTINLYQTNISSRGELRMNAVTGSTAIYYCNITNYISRLYLNATTRALVYSLQIASNGRYDANNGEARAYYSTIDSQAQYTCTGLTGQGYIYYSHLMSGSRFSAQGSARIYMSTLGSRAYINSNNFTFSQSTAFGSGTNTLSGNNTNRYKFHGALNNLI